MIKLALKLALVIFCYFGTVAAFAFVAYERGVIDGINEAAGCGPDQPAEVPYHDGMTLCPGQTATMEMEVPMPGAPIDLSPRTIRGLRTEEEL